MKYSISSDINFPNLGLHFKNVGRFINIHGFQIAYYGIIIAFAMLVGFFVAVREAKRTNQNVEDYYTMGIIGIIAGIIGARIYYVIFAFDEFKGNLIQIFNIRGGGLAIYGGIIGAVITMLIWSKIKKKDKWQLFDTVTLGIVIGQVIGRFGNFFNREVFGGFTRSLFAMEIPINAVNDISDLNTKILSNVITHNGIKYISVHPTFLYESFWNLLIFIGLMIYRKHKKFEGELFCLYLVFYGIGRAIIEAVRTDQLLIPLINIPVSIVVSIIAIIFAALVILKKRNIIH